MLEMSFGSRVDRVVMDLLGVVQISIFGLDSFKMA